MPIYDYHCSGCGYQQERLQAMDAPAPPCPTCGTRLQRWIRSAPAIHGAAASGRERAARSLPACGKGCRCCP